MTAARVEVLTNEASTPFGTVQAEVLSALKEANKMKNKELVSWVELEFKKIRSEAAYIIVCANASPHCRAAAPILTDAKLGKRFARSNCIARTVPCATCWRKRSGKDARTRCASRSQRASQPTRRSSRLWPTQSQHRRPQNQPKRKRNPRRAQQSKPLSRNKRPSPHANTRNGFCMSFTASRPWPTWTQWPSARSCPYANANGYGSCGNGCTARRIDSGESSSRERKSKQKRRNMKMESEKAKRIWDAQRLALPEGVHVATARQLARFAARIEQSVNNPTMSEEEIETSRKNWNQSRRNG